MGLGSAKRTAKRTSPPFWLLVFEGTNLCWVVYRGHQEEPRHFIHQRSTHTQTHNACTFFPPGKPGEHCLGDPQTVRRPRAPRADGKKRAGGPAEGGERAELRAPGDRGAAAEGQAGGGAWKAKWRILVAGEEGMGSMGCPFKRGRTMERVDSFQPGDVFSFPPPRSRLQQSRRSTIRRANRKSNPEGSSGQAFFRGRGLGSMGSMGLPLQKGEDHAGVDSKTFSHKGSGFEGWKIKLMGFPVLTYGGLIQMFP